jgi:segregation and condensation protein A
MILQSEHFVLANFEGTLDFLLCLIQKDEIDIHDISIQKLIQQFIHKLPSQREWLEKGAEFIGMAAYLVWLKSKTLLPCHVLAAEPQEKIEDPHFEMIHHLIDYCRFKNAAKELAARHEKRQGCYFRGIEKTEGKTTLGIEHLSLKELSQIFLEMMNRTTEVKHQIQNENWHIMDMIRNIRCRLRDTTSFPLAFLLSPTQSRLEIIVIFLAILELMKSGELVVSDFGNSELMIFAKTGNKGKN